MLTFPNFLFVLININQDEITDANQLGDIEIDSNIATLDETFKLVIENLWQRVQDGLTLTDIENILFFILFVRFMILAFRYNLKTSFYMTCIGLCAGYLWYRHIIDIILS